LDKQFIYRQIKIADNKRFKPIKTADDSVVVVIVVVVASVVVVNVVVSGIGVVVDVVVAVVVDVVFDVVVVGPVVVVNVVVFGIDVVVDVVVASFVVDENRFLLTASIGPRSFAVVSTTVASGATMVAWKSAAVSSDVILIRSSTKFSLCLLRRKLATPYAHLI